MSLLEEIHEAAIDGESDLGTLLRKCKVLAAHLGSKPLEDWLLWESNGYPKDIEPPDYRVWPLEVKGHFSGSYGSGLRNAPVPTYCIPEDSRESYRRYKCRESVSLVETALRETDEGILRVSTNDLAVALGQKVYQGLNCLQAWAEFPKTHFVEVLNTVRNRVLDFSLAIWKEYPGAGENYMSEGSGIEPSKVTQIFNLTIFGGAANLVGIASGSQVTLNIVERDFNSLKTALLRSGIQESDIDELESILSAESETTTKKAFSPGVSSWIANMVGKAASGSWQVGVGAAGAMLAQALSKYFGF